MLPAELIANVIADLRTHVDIRAVGNVWNTFHVRLRDGSGGETVGDYYEGNADTGSERKVVVAIPSASNAERVELELLTRIRFLDLDRGLPEKQKPPG